MCEESQDLLKWPFPFEFYQLGVRAHDKQQLLCPISHTWQWVTDLKLALSVWKQSEGITLVFLLLVLEWKESARELQLVPYLRPAGDKDVELCSKRLKRRLLFQEITLHNNKTFHCYVHSGSLRPFPVAGSEGHLGAASKYFPALCWKGQHAVVCDLHSSISVCLCWFIS